MDEEGISMEEFKDAFQKGNLFASGIGKSSRQKIRPFLSTHGIRSMRMESLS